MLKNKIWMMKFLLRKKCMGYLAIITVMYLVLIPYQINLLKSFPDLEMAKGMFWKGAYLYHTVFAVTFISLSAMQLMNSEVRELFSRQKREILYLLCGIFLVYQIAAAPPYIWYGSMYPGEPVLLLGLIVSELLGAGIYVSVALLCQNTIVAYVGVFVGILFILG